MILRAGSRNHREWDLQLTYFLLECPASEAGRAPWVSVALACRRSGLKKPWAAFQAAIPAHEECWQAGSRPIWVFSALPATENEGKPGSGFISLGQHVVDDSHGREKRG